MLWGVLGLSGCTSLLAPSTPVYNDPVAQSCANLYHTLNNRVVDRGVIDAVAYRVPGYPYFRSSRFLSSFSSALPNNVQRQTVPTQKDATRDWLVQLNQLAIDGLLLEWQRLSPEERQRVDKQVVFPLQARALVQDRLRVCGAILIQSLLQREGSQDLAFNGERFKDEGSLGVIVDRAVVPDAYQGWKRWLGLYPLVALPFTRGVERELEAVRELQLTFASQPESSVSWNHYRPDPADEARVTKEIFTEMRLDALGIPQLSPLQRTKLLSAWAPAIAVQAAADNDSIGRLEKKPAGLAGVNTGDPGVYTFVSYGRFQGQVTIQLNYSFWFSERRKTRWLDLLAGQLDGLLWRVHLSLDGELLAYDSIHNCGCWYQLYPGEHYRVDPQLAEAGESIYVAPASVRPSNVRPGSSPGAVTLFLQANTHTLLGLKSAYAVADYRPLSLWPYRQLRAMRPGEDGGGEEGNSMAGEHAEAWSPFDHRGLIASSRRLERFFFWPMGIDSPGAMRVVGTHAIAFVGRRHFDSPELLESLGLTPVVASSMDSDSQ